MTSKTFISELSENQNIQTTFLAADKGVRTTKNGKPYLCVTLVDRTGELDGRGWDNAETLAGRFEDDDFVKVRGKVTSWDGNLQINIGDVRRVPREEVQLEDYLPHSRWSADDMFDQLLELVDGCVQSPEIRRFLKAVLSRDDVAGRLKRAPAAKSNHHSYHAGLLEHILSMARLGARISRHYAHYYPGFLNQDLVIAGCILHDIGKIDELSFELSASYSTEGKLIGHITQGVELITRVAGQMDSPPSSDVLQHLKHLVLSHHGKREYGTPVEPRTAEAMLLHQIDMIDSRMNMFHNHIAEHRNGLEADEDWTPYHRTLGRSIFAGPSEPPPWARSEAPDPDTVAGPGDCPDEPKAASEAPAGEDAAAAAGNTNTLDMFGN